MRAKGTLLSPQGSWGPEAPDEAELLLRARSGDRAAVAALYRAHLDSGRRLAVLLAGPANADDLLQDSFARVLTQLQAGRGPSTNFRSYLFTVIRNGHRDGLRHQGREEPASHQAWLLDEPTDPVAELIEGRDDHAVAALTRLPENWQRVLWMLEVEGRGVSEVAEAMCLTPSAVSSLCYRAREGLRTAYLDQRVGPTPAHSACRWVRERLSKYVRAHLTPHAVGRVDAHLTACGKCEALRDELQQVNRRLAALTLRPAS